MPLLRLVMREPASPEPTLSRYFWLVCSICTIVILVIPLHVSHTLLEPSLELGNEKLGKLRNSARPSRVAEEWASKRMGGAGRGRLQGTSPRTKTTSVWDSKRKGPGAAALTHRRNKGAHWADPPAGRRLVFALQHRKRL